MSSGKAVFCTTLKNVMLDWAEVEVEHQAESQVVPPPSCPAQSVFFKKNKKGLKGLRHIDSIET